MKKGDFIKKSPFSLGRTKLRPAAPVERIALGCVEIYNRCLILSSMSGNMRRAAISFHFLRASMAGVPK